MSSFSKYVIYLKLRNIFKFGFDFTKSPEIFYKYKLVLKFWKFFDLIFCISKGSRWVKPPAFDSRQFIETCGTFVEVNLFTIRLKTTTFRMQHLNTDLTRSHKVLFCFSSDFNIVFHLVLGIFLQRITYKLCFAICLT